MTKIQRDVLIALGRGATIEYRHGNRYNDIALVNETSEKVIQVSTFNLLKGKGWIRIARTDYSRIDKVVGAYTITETGKADAKDGGGL